MPAEAGGGGSSGAIAIASARGTAIKAQDADLLVRLIKHALPEQFAEEASDELSVEEADLMEQVVNKAIKAREQAKRDKGDGDPA